MRRTWSLGLALSFLACAEPSPELDDGLADEAPSSAELPIVYGNDDRREVYEDVQGGPSNVRSLASTSIVALVPKGRIQRPATGEVVLNASTLGSAYQLCKGERFMEQPTAADCTGVLIDSDLIVTAGHCVQDTKCSDYHYVFDYYYRAPGELEPIGSNDIFACRQVVVEEISDRNGRQIDFAVIQLDRAATGRTPLRIRSLAANVDEALAVIGVGSGLPIKIDRGARAIDGRAAQRDYFELEADTFEGSSGSAIVDRDGALLGILVRGGADYVTKEGADCEVVNQQPRALPGTLPSGDLAHEEATYVARAIESMCDRGFPSAALCTRPGACGDNFCSLSETRASCPIDCDPCRAGACGARGDLRATASRSVKQSPGSGRAGDGSGCSLVLGGGLGARSSGALLALLVLLALRRRFLLAR